MKNRFYFILLVIFVFLNIGLGSWGLAETSEARYAEISREMVLSGDYLHPTLLGIQHYHKPPITYYITAIGYKIFGINEFGARFFLSVALILQLFFVFKIGRLLFKEEKIAFFSALIYFSFPVVLIAARNLTTDAYLATFILWSIYNWLQYKKGKPAFYLYAFYAMLGLAFLTKGPVALLPVIVFISCWKWIYKEKLQFSKHTLLGNLLFLIVAGSWFAAIIIDKPQLWNYFIDEQIVNRTIAAQNFHRDQPFWYYLVLAPLLGFPWLVFIVLDLKRKFRAILKEKSITLILVITIVSSLFIFSAFSSKLVLYILPIYSFISLLAGYILFTSTGKWINIYVRVYIGLFSLLLLGLIVGGLGGWVLLDVKYAILLILFTAGVGIYLIKYPGIDQRFQLIYLGMSFSICLLFTDALFSSGNPYMINSAKELMGFAKQKSGKDFNRLIVYDYLLPSPSFYLDDEIVTVENANFKSQREIRFEKAAFYKRNFLDLKQKEDMQRFKDLMREKGNILIERKGHPMNDSLDYILKNFSQCEEMNKWIIYY
ncbi:MAG: glycosyltransferase family 39 protein [Flavobacteriaceae bacterium]|nr:glycosyltransferase family 39 protein [Flavobacteriaceae bacterium]